MKDKAPKLTLTDIIKEISDSSKNLTKEELAEKIGMLKSFPFQTPEIKDLIQKLQQLM